MRNGFSAMKLHNTATEGPWVPEPIIVNEAPIPIQTPKPYVLVMLKGFCTEFFDSEEQMVAFAVRCRVKGWPFLSFYYDTRLGQYSGYIEFWRPPMGDPP